MPSIKKGVGSFTADHIVAVLRALPDTDGTYAQVIARATEHGAQLAGDRLVDNVYVPVTIEELPGGVMEGYSAVLNLHLRWEQGQLAWYDPATGNPILTHEDQHGRADAEREARVRAEARVQELEAELRRLQNP